MFLNPDILFLNAACLNGSHTKISPRPDV